MKMQRNHNEQQIVMSVEHYNNLLGMADRNRYATAKIERHVRKFNPFLQAPHQERVKAFESKRSERIREARALVENYHGKLVLANTKVHHHDNDEQGKIYTQVRVQCINAKNRALVDTYKPEDTKPHWIKRNEITACAVIFEQPEGYIQLLGPGTYQNLFVKEWSPIHWCHIQEQARREDFERDNHKERRLKDLELKSDDRAQCVSYDVIGER